MVYFLPASTGRTSMADDEKQHHDARLDALINRSSRWSCGRNTHRYHTRVYTTLVSTQYLSLWSPRVVDVDHPWPGVLSAALPPAASLDAVRRPLGAARVRARRRPARALRHRPAPPQLPGAGGASG